MDISGLTTAKPPIDNEGNNAEMQNNSAHPDSTFKSAVEHVHHQRSAKKKSYHDSKGQMPEMGK